MEISTEKTKIMAFCGKEPVPSKICLNNNILERVNNLNILAINHHSWENYTYLEKFQNAPKAWA
jgi:hypothetical protein